MMTNLRIIATNRNDDGRADCKQAPIHGCAALHDRLRCKMQHLSRQAAVGSPEHTRKKTKNKVFFKRALAKMLRLAGDAHRQEFGK